MQPETPAAARKSPEEEELEDGGAQGLVL